MRRTFRRYVGSSVVVMLVTAATALVIAAPAAATAAYDPAADVNSMNGTTAYTGVTDWWDAGFTGAGVDVAVIDTGVLPVDGLATPGKIVYGPDLSLDSQDSELRNLDAYGHGTFMAGIIAGNGPDARFLGVAPDARIVSVKVGAANGSVDVSQVIAAIDWVVQHRHDNGLNIRVLNLLVRHGLHAALHGRPAGLRRRAGVEGGHLRGGRHRQRGLRVQDGHADEPGLRPEDLRRRRIRFDGHRQDGRRHGRSVLLDREQRSIRRRRRARRAHRQPAGAGLLHRSGLRIDRVRQRHAVPRQWHERGGRLHVGRGGARDRAASRDHSRQAQEAVPEQHTLPQQLLLDPTGSGPGRHVGDAERPHLQRPEAVEHDRLVDGDRLARAVPRHRTSDGRGPATHR